MSCYSSPEAIDWLCVVLEERFGHSFTLQLQSNKTLKIMCGLSAASIQLPVSGEIFTRSDSDLPCTYWDATAEGWQVFFSSNISCPGVELLPYPLIEPVAQGYRIHYDILGMTYWMLSRQEEVGRNDLDTHGRFPATSSHAFKYGYLERPVVDEWLHILGQVIQKTWPSIELKSHQFNIKVSHDVDLPSRYGFCSWRAVLRGMVGNIIRHGDVMSALRAPWIRLNSLQKLQPADPANTFDWLMDVSEKHGLTSAFYFICGRTDIKKDADYEPTHPAIRNLMRNISSRGHEIGLHPSYGSYQKPEIISAEAIKLRRIMQEEGIVQKVLGGRMHYLRWQHPTTLNAWANAGMTYDSTLGYADRPGFRCGTSFEYPAYDPVSGTMLPIRIRPLIAMEGTIISSRYMGLGTGEVALSKFLELKYACQAVGGCFTLLWHNSKFESKNEKKLYESILES